MALPKRRHSKARVRKRRTHQGVSAPSVSACPQCEAPRLPHNACGRCGYYKGRKIDHTVSEEEKRRESAS